MLPATGSYYEHRGDAIPDRWALLKLGTFKYCIPEVMFCRHIIIIYSLLEMVAFSLL